MSNKSISIVATSYSLARYHDMVDLINSCLLQSYQNLELIIVIEESDELYKKILDYTKLKAYFPIHVLFGKKLGLVGARNLGVEKSTKDIIAFVDDDVILDKQWAAEILKMFDHTHAIGVAGRCSPLLLDGNNTNLPQELDWLIGSTSSYDLEPGAPMRNAWGMNMAFRRSLFDSGLRFNQDCGMWSVTSEAWGARPPEDVDFSIRSRAATGGQILYSQFACALHKVPYDRLNVISIIKRSYFLGRQRYLVKYNYANIDTNVLTVEKQLLRRILSKTVPRAIKSIPKKPKVGVYQIAITSVVVFSVFIGYSFCKVKRRPLKMQCSAI
jgi:glucosyl-dolichyl phosphate glucuronosyltransferase